MFGVITALLFMDKVDWTGAVLGYGGAFALLFVKEKGADQRVALRKSRRAFEKAIDEQNADL